MSRPTRSDLLKLVSMAIPSLLGYVWKGTTLAAAEDVGDPEISSFNPFQGDELGE